MSYRRFAAMIAAGTVVMFGLMYLNTYAIGHVRFSQTRMWMALLMGAAMAVVMLGFMWPMYRGLNISWGSWAGRRRCSRSACSWCAARRRWTT